MQRNALQCNDMQSHEMHWHYMNWNVMKYNETSMSYSETQKARRIWDTKRKWKKVPSEDVILKPLQKICPYFLFLFLLFLLARRRDVLLLMLPLPQLADGRCSYSEYFWRLNIFEHFCQLAIWKRCSTQSYSKYFFSVLSKVNWYSYSIYYFHAGLLNTFLLPS